LDGKKPLVAVDGEEGLRDMRIIDALYTAVRIGKRVNLK
jgi:predicted dehydrogenase